MTNEGLELIKKYEGLRLSPYLCPAGIPTIGYGTTVYPDATPVSMSDPKITAAKATAILKTEVAKYEDKIDEWTGGGAADYELAGMTSLAYNIGLSAFSKSTILRLYKAGKLREAAAAFSLWNKARVDGSLIVLPGLVARRAEEAAMFANAKAGENMPQEIEAPKPLERSRTMVGTVTAATGGVATVTAGVQAVGDLKNAASSFAPWMPHLLTVGAILAVVGIAYIAYSRWDDRRKGIR